MRAGGAFMVSGFTLALIAASPSARAGPAPVPRAALDHIIIGAPDLDRAVQVIERRTGVRATYGGAHPGGGTRNALIALDGGAYLEIIAPDPAQKRPGEFGRYVASLRTMTPLGWAYRTADLQSLRSALRANGVRVEPIEPGARRRPDGRMLRWQTFEIGSAEDVSPFFIQWDKRSPHPSVSAARGCRLARLSFGGPMRPNLARALAVIGQSAMRQRNAAAGLHGALQCRRGALRF